MIQQRQVLKKGQLKSFVDKTFEKSKSYRHKNLKTGAPDGYAGLSNREILKVTKNNIKYKRFKARFTSKAVQKPLIPSEVESAYFSIYICPFLIHGSKPHKLHFKIIKARCSILLNAVILDFRKTGNMLEALDWELNFSVLKHFKNLR